MTINCDRWTQIDFSSEYFHAGQKILVRTDSTATSIADLNGKRMCAAKGSTNIDNLKNYPKIIVVRSTTSPTAWCCSSRAPSIP